MAPLFALERKKAHSSYDVSVKDSQGCDLDPCRAARARMLLKRGRAVILTCNPMTIQLIYKKANGHSKSSQNAS